MQPNGVGVSWPHREARGELMVIVPTRFGPRRWPFARSVVLKQFSYISTFCVLDSVLYMLACRNVIA